MIVAFLLVALQLPPATAPEQPGSNELVQLYDARLAEAQRQLSAAGPAESIAGELARREQLYQARLAAMSVVAGLSTEGFVPQALIERSQAADAADVVYLRSVLPANGWLRKSRDGAATVSNAWLLLQHVGDPKLMEESRSSDRPIGGFW
jgi:hypothetical protein